MLRTLEEVLGVVAYSNWATLQSDKTTYDGHAPACIVFREFILSFERKVCIEFPVGNDK
jgi:hypothetical protein